MMTDSKKLLPDTLVTLPKGEMITGRAVLNSPAKLVWGTVGNFAGFATFISGLVYTEMIGTGVRSVRKKIFNDGNIVLEQLNSHSNEKMLMTWSLLYTTFNIGNLWASMRVLPITDNSCEVIWDIIADPWEGGDAAVPEFTNFLKGFLAMAISNLETMYNK